MTFSEWSKKKKKEETEETTEAPSFTEWHNEKYNTYNRVIKEDDDDIAPVTTRSWVQKGAFEDGYQFGDVTKTILGTDEDLQTNFMAGILGIGEKALDAGTTLVGGVGKLFGADDFAETAKELAAKDLYDEEKVAHKMLEYQPQNLIKKLLYKNEYEENSVLGERSDSLAQSAGQLAGTVAFQSVGVPWYVTSGVTSFGSEAENAFNQGASYGEAVASATIAAGAEILTEKLFGGSGLGEKGLINTSRLTRGISNKVVKLCVDFGINMLTEGSEEVATEIFNNLGSALYKEENAWELLTNEEALDGYLESFVGGIVLGGAANVGKVVNSAKTGRDYNSGLTTNEQKVVDAELQNRIDEAQKDGKTLTKKEKAAIEEQVLNDLKKGYISTDVIESVLGGETYKTYQDTIANEDATIKELSEMYEGAELEAAIKDITDNSKRGELRDLLSKEVSDLAVKSKDGFLTESYNERTRRTQAFTADLSKYEGKTHETIKKAVESGILNDTNRTHEFVDMIAKISADKGVSFDFVNNKKLRETGFAVADSTVNGYVTSEGVTLNIDSAKALNSVVGHEITHVLEGTELYDALQEAVFEYAKTKGEYMDRLKNTRNLYKDIDGYKGVDGFKAIKREVVSDLVGDYLFTDADFVNNLSVQHRNVFQKIYDEIKYLCKVATAGSKEARELEKAKRIFEEAYRASSESKTADTKYSLAADDTGRKLSPEVARRFENSKVVDEDGNLKTVYHGTATGEFSIFDKAKGSVEGDFGSGFYFTDNEADVSEHYEGGGPDFDIKVGQRADEIWNENPDLEYEEAEEMARKELFKGSHKFEVYLNIKNPAIVGETKLMSDSKYLEEYNEEDYDSYDDYIADVEQLVADDIDNIIWEIERNVDVDSTDGIADILYNAYCDGGIGLEELKKKLNNLYLEDSNGKLVANEVARQIIESLGYDGIIDPTVSGKWNMDIEEGTTHYIAFKPNQIKAVTNENPTDNPDIHRSLSKEGEAQKQYGGIYGKDIKLDGAAQTQDIAEQAENIAPAQDIVSENAVDNTVDNTVAEEAPEVVPEDETKRFSSLTDADAPPETEAPYYGESEEVTAADPFESRDIKDVGNKKVKAYMYENPEVKPFFQMEANAMLGDLQRSTKGERFPIIGEDGYITGWTGAKRETSSEIAYLRDELNYTYAEIEKGLKAIIEDNGAENNACSKRIEFLLNDMLLNGTTDFITGEEIPPNQDYIKLLNEKQITEYNEDAFKRYVEKENADNFAPIAETTAETAVSEEKYEAIRPPREKQPSMQEAEPRMKRADSKNNAPHGKEERSFIETATGSEAVDGVITPDDVPDALRYYEVKSNKKSLEAANRIIEKNGFSEARKYFNNRMESGKITAEDMALGQRLIQEAAKAGDAQACLELLVDTSIIGTEHGQVIQAMSMIRRLSPEGQLRALTRIVERGKAKGDKAFDGVEKKDLNEAGEIILGAYNEDGTFDQEKLNAAVEEAKQKIADKMKVTNLEKVNAWRYLSMLGNPKTHARNVISNAANFVARIEKNAIARTAEDIAPVIAPKWSKRHLKAQAQEASKATAAAQGVLPAGTIVTAKDRGNIGTILSYDAKADKYSVHFKNKAGHSATVNLSAKIVEPIKKAASNGKTGDGENIGPVHARTKTWLPATDDVKAFAKRTTEEMLDVIKGENKYSEGASIKAKRKIWESKAFGWLNKVSDFNTKALEWEDSLFSKYAFKRTLQEYLTANGISNEADIKNNPEIVEKAKNYALEEAYRATFRQDSYIAKKIGEIEQKNPIYGVVIGSTMPFKKTPINVAKTGLAYSPLGIARNIYDAVKVHKGEMDASEAIDHIAQTVTGTSLMMVGAFFASLGVLNGAGNDDKEGKYDYQLGKQTYSFSFGGDTYSLSWLSPAAMPLFVGVNAYEQLVEGKEWDMNMVIDALGQTLDPLSEMSFVSSLNDVLSSYDDGIGKIWGAGESMVQNYATQFIPTLSSQIASIADTKKRSTQASRDSGFSFGEETLRKMAYKVPGARNLLEPTTDIWGEEVEQGNFIQRAWNSLLNPANKREGIETAVDTEIKDLYRQTGDAGLIPSIPYSYFNYDGEKYEMSADEYTEFKQEYGQTAYSLLETLFDTDTYRAATSEERAEMVNKIYDYARDEARKSYLAGLGVDFTNATAEGEEYYKENAIVGALEADLPVDEYTFSVEYPEKYEFFKENGISYETYRDADEDGKRAYSWAYENPGKYTLSKAITDDFMEYYSYRSEMNDFDAKDENGNTVSGLKKERVSAYINSLNLDYGQKMILYRSMYDSKEDQKTYNKAIVEYLNSRNDISYEQGVTILKELGMTVRSDGTVTW